MPSCRDSSPPPPPAPAPAPAWTVATAQTALGDAACQVLAVVDLLETVYKGLPRPADLADRQEHRKPYNVATEVLATIECVLADNLRPAVGTLHHLAHVTDADLEREYRDWRKRRIV
jgi:hypothetical protein